MSVLGFSIILQQGQHDEYIFDTILGIGAMARARNSTPTQVPLIHHRMSGALKNQHYQRALHHYDSAIQKLKTVVSTAQPEAQLQVMYTSCLLFLMFEVLQENSRAVDRLGGIGMACLSRLSPTARSSYVQSASSVTRFMTNGNVVYVSLSPQSPSIRSAIRTEVSTIFQPPSVVGPKASMHEFIAAWWRLLTTVINLCVHPAARDFGREKSDTAAQLPAVLALIGSWEKETQKRVAAAQEATSIKLLQLVVTITNRLALVAQQCERVNWKPAAGEISCFFKDALEYAAILKLFKLCREQPVNKNGMPCAQDEFDVTNEVAHSPALPALLHIARQSPSHPTRLEALELFRSMLHPKSASNLKAVYMVLRALADIERWGLTNHYDWTKGSWNDAYTALHVTFTPVRRTGNQRLVPRHLVLKAENYGF